MARHPAFAAYFHRFTRLSLQVTALAVMFTTHSAAPVVSAAVNSAPLATMSVTASPIATRDLLLYPEVRLRKLHLVRPDLIPYPISYDIYC
jgi:hypothetical protein